MPPSKKTVKVCLASQFKEQEANNKSAQTSPLRSVLRAPCVRCFKELAPLFGEYPPARVLRCPHIMCKTCCDQLLAASARPKCPICNIIFTKVSTLPLYL